MQAQDIVTAALREIMIVRTGQTPSSLELQDGFNKLNRMIANWNTERLIVTAMVRFVGNLVASQQQYTIGSSGSPSFNTQRPISIHSATIITAAGSFVRPLKLVDEIEFNATPGRSRQAAIPLKLWYQATYPLGVIWVWPVPNGASALELYNWAQLAQFVALTDTFDLQPGYEQAIVLNLAVELTAQFERQPAPSLVAAAQKAKAAITGVNVPPIPGAAEEIQSRGVAQPMPPAGAVPVSPQQ